MSGWSNHIGPLFLTVDLSLCWHCKTIVLMLDCLLTVPSLFYQVPSHVWWLDHVKPSALPSLDHTRLSRIARVPFGFPLVACVHRWSAVAWRFRSPLLSLPWRSPYDRYPHPSPWRWMRVGHKTRPWARDASSGESSFQWRSLGPTSYVCWFLATMT